MTAAGSPVLIRYADDLVALCHTRDEALEVKARLAEWLAPRGLGFNEDKTRVVCLDEGFDFLGFNVRRYHGKLLIKPSKAALRRIRERLRTEMRSLRGANARAVIKRLNPIIRGWAAYYRGVVSSEIFHALDRHLWTLTYKWAVFSHSNKPTRWVVDRYFGQFNKSRRDRWVFGDRDSGAYLHKFAWTRIYRHQMVRGTASPDDPALTDYWAERRRKAPLLPIGNASLRLYEAQHGRCPLCRGPLLPDEDLPQSPREWEHWQAATRKTITTITMREDGTSDRHQTPSRTPPLLPTAQRRRRQRSRHFCPPASPQGLLEPDASRGARPVLRGVGRSNALDLPGQAPGDPAGHSAFKALDNGFAGCEDPVALAEICASLSAAEVQAFFDRWQAALPSPLSAEDRARGYQHELAFRQPGDLRHPHV